MPNAVILAPGYGAQGAGAEDADAAARADGSGILVNASRNLMYAWRKRSGLSPADAAAEAAKAMRAELNAAIALRPPVD
jgi:orotidine-5'-phosphate decarboxylase